MYSRKWLITIPIGTIPPTTTSLGIHLFWRKDWLITDTPVVGVKKSRQEGNQKYCTRNIAMSKTSFLSFSSITRIYTYVPY
jgi:hypothetical protein